MGIPVITNSGVGDVAMIVEKYHSGIILKDLTEHGLKVAAEKIILRNNFNLEEIRNAAKEFYNLENAVEKYHDIYQKIFNVK